MFTMVFMRRAARRVFLPFVLSIAFLTPVRAQIQDWTFERNDLAPFESALEDLAKIARKWPKVGSDYLGYALSWPQDRPRSRSEPRDAWNAGLTILKYPDVATAKERWRRGLIGSNFINYRRDEIEAARASLERHGLGGRIEVEDDLIVDWSARYHPRVFSGRGVAPQRRDDRRYWIRLKLQILRRHRNTIISSLSGIVIQVEGQRPIGSTMLKFDPWQLDELARRLVDAKWGDAAPEEPIEAEPEPDDEVDELYLKRSWYSGLLEAMTRARREAALARMTLSVQRLAVGKLRHRIDQLRLILREDDVDDGIFDASEELHDWWCSTRDRISAATPSAALKQAIRKRIAELEGQLGEIEKEQAEVLTKQERLLDDIEHELDRYGRDIENGSLRRGVEAQRRALTFMRELGMLELKLASGRRPDFDAAAQNLLRAGKHDSAVRFMQGLAELEDEQPRAALRAFRLALEADPKNAGASEQLRLIEAAYLRRIDAQVLGEAAALRKLCMTRLEAGGEDGYWGALKAHLTIGIFSATSALAGREDALSDLASIYADDAAATHAGLMIATRLREKGLALDYIEQMNNVEFIAALADHFGKDVDAPTARRMRASLKAAFRNPDLNRLLEGSRAQLAVDRGSSYLDTAEFRNHWLQDLGDGINVKNMAIMLGPMSVLRANGQTATLAYWGRFMGSAQAPRDIVTLKDAFASFVGLQKLADRLVETKTGRGCAEAILRWHESTGLVSHLLADALVQQGGIHAAKKVGELVGCGPELALLAEIFTAYGVGDIDVSVKLLKQTGIGGDDLRRLVRGFRNAASDLESRGLPSREAKRLRALIDGIAEGQQPDAAQLRALRDSVKRLDGRIATLEEGFRQSKRGLGELSEQQTLVALKQAARDAGSGHSKLARKSLDLAEEMDALRGHVAKTLKKGELDAGAVERSLRSAGGAGGAGLPPGAGRSARPGLEGHLKGEGLAGADLRDLDLDGKGWRRGMDRLMLENDAKRAARGYRKMAGFAESIDDERKLAALRRELARRAEFAERVAEAQRRLDLAAALEEGSRNAKAAEEFGAAELRRIQGEASLEFVEIPGTKDAPWHVIKRAPDGSIVERWVFKEGAHRRQAETAQIVARMGRDLGIDVPQGSFVTLERAGAKVEGTLYRYVDGEQLLDCDLATQFAVKKDMGEARILRCMAGDYDLQAKNVMIGAHGRRFQLDFDQADLIGMDLSGDPRASLPEQALEQLDLLAGAAESPAARGNKLYEIVAGIERQVTLDELDGMIRRIERTWTRDYMRKHFLKGVETMDEDALLDILEARRDVLRKAMVRRYGTLKSHLTSRRAGRQTGPIRFRPGTDLLHPPRTFAQISGPCPRQP